jgi:hypothetical protein
VVVFHAPQVRAIREEIELSFAHETVMVQFEARLVSGHAFRHAAKSK